MYFEKENEEKKTPLWDAESGISAYILPEYKPIKIPISKKNYFITGITGTGKTQFVKKIIRHRLSEESNLRLAILQIKPHDFDELMGDRGVFICQNSTGYPKERVFRWNAMKEFRSGGEENYLENIQEFTSIAASEYHKSAGANLYFVSTAEESIERYFVALLNSTSENIPNDKTFGFLENEEPEKILRIIANYPPNLNFLKIHFDYDPQDQNEYKLTKRGHDREK